MPTLRIDRDIQIPDSLRVARARSAPQFGPRVLFFSGGSALNGISRRLKRLTHNSVHLVTPFDSGGSSRILREAFDMPAVGDLRSRLMALADESVLGQPEIYALFTHRLPAAGDATELHHEIMRLRSGVHPLLAAIAPPMQQLIRAELSAFFDRVPDRFDYRNASIGNLIIAGGYLARGRGLEQALFMMSKMVDVRGTVRALVDDNLHMGVELEDGRRILSQRMLSGKENPPIDSPVTRLFLTDGTAELPPAQVPLPERNHALIAGADVICYPPGSLYSSVAVNLVPAGVGRSVAGRTVAKVYLPALGHDPEAFGHDLGDQIDALLRPLRQDAGEDLPAARFLTHVLCDVSVPPATCAEASERHGIPVIRLPLARRDGLKYDPETVAEILVSLG